MRNRAWYPIAMLFLIFALLVCQLPFEARVPLLHLAGFTVTNLELTAYLALAVAAWTAVKRNTSFDPLDWALLAWCAAWLMAGLSAPIDNYESALRHAARMMIGPMICLFARAVLAPRERERLGTLLVTTAVVAAAMGILDLFFPSLLKLLVNLFRETPTLSPFGRRAAGTFEHANQFSAFLELALPAALLLTKRTFRVVSVGLLVLGILLSLSRAGWVASIIGATVALTLAASFWPVKTRQAGNVVAALVTILILILLIPAVRLRIFSWFIAPPLAASYKFETTPSYGIRITNLGKFTWKSHETGQTLLVLHFTNLEPTSGEGSDFLELPQDVAPGENVLIPLHRKRIGPGKFLHIYDLWHPDYGYASQWNSPPLAGITLCTSTSLKFSPDPSVLAPHLKRASRFQLWYAAWNIFAEHPFLGIGPGQFQTNYPRWLPHVTPDPSLHANQLYLGILAEGGVIALLAFAGIVFTALRLLAIRGRGKFPAMAVALGALACWLAHGTLDTFLLFNGVAWTFWLLISLLPKETVRP